MNKKLILASASPRRRELLNMIGIHGFDIIPAPFEAELDTNLPPYEAVMKVALLKAQSVAESCGADKLILGADTVVCIENRILEKPENETAACEMLKLLSGATHSVYTGIALISEGAESCDYVKTDVSFREISDAEIRRYAASGEPMDKAGAYGAQGRGAVFVEHIDGDFFNVVGLPLCKLTQMLRNAGYEI